MFDDYEPSYADLDTSFLRTGEFNLNEEDQCEISFSNNSLTKENTLSTSVNESHSFSLKQNSNMQSAVTVSGFYNPKFKPIVDDGKEYRYEDNPSLYRKIRK